jgi:hypothetical protein
MLTKKPWEKHLEILHQVAIHEYAPALYSLSANCSYDKALLFDFIRKAVLQHHYGSFLRLHGLHHEHTGKKSSLLQACLVRIHKHFSGSSNNGNYFLNLVFDRWKSEEEKSLYHALFEKADEETRELVFKKCVAYEQPDVVQLVVDTATKIAQGLV